MRRSLLALVLLGACGDYSIADFNDDSLEALCTYYFRCGQFASHADCRAYFGRIRVEDPSLAAAVEAGKTRFDEDAAHACVDAIASLSCDATTVDGHELDICDDAFVGTGGENAPCAFDAECASDRCLVPSCEEACCTGLCAPAAQLPGIGQPCSFACAEGAYCAEDSTCKMRLPAGAACAAADSCERGHECAGLTPSTTGVCKRLPQRGEPCVGGCAQVGDLCNGGTCVEVGLPGDPCETAADCSVFYVCENSQCAPPPSAGEPCTITCSGAAWCNETICEAQKANGATCVRNDECTSHHCSRGTCSDVPLCI